MAGLSRPAEWTTEESEVVVTVAKRVERSASRGASAESVGRSVPLGATVVEGGVNFSLFSRNAAGVELLFFDREDDATPSRTVRVEPSTNRTYHYWHVFVPRVPPGQFFAHAQRRATGCRSGGRNRERARWFQRNLRHRPPWRRGGDGSAALAGRPRPVGGRQQPHAAPADAIAAVPGHHLRVGPDRIRSLGLRGRPRPGRRAHASGMRHRHRRRARVDASGERRGKHCRGGARTIIRRNPRCLAV